MTKLTTSALASAAILALTACGGGGSNEPQTTSVNTGTGYYLDSAVEGIEYACGSQSGKTDKEGKFIFEEGKKCQFTLAGIPVKSIAADQLHDGVKIVEDDVKVARFLQSIDADGDPSNGITITDEVLEAMQQAVEDLKSSGDVQDPKEVIENNTTFATVVTKIQNKVTNFKGQVVTKEEASEHLEQTQTGITKELLAGKTFYKVQVSSDNKYDGQIRFNDNVTEIIEIQPGEPDSSETIAVHGKKVVYLNSFSPLTSEYFLITATTDKYIQAEYYIVSQGKDELDETVRFYFNKSDAESYLKSLTSGGSATSGDLSWIVRKTLYECDGESLTFQDDGNIKLIENDGSAQYIPYSIEGNTIYTKEGNEQESHSLIEKTDTYVKFKDGDMDTSTFYFNLEDAQNAPADDCDSDDGDSSTSDAGFYDKSLFVGKTFYDNCGQQDGVCYAKMTFTDTTLTRHEIWTEDGEKRDETFTLNYSLTRGDIVVEGTNEGKSYVITSRLIDEYSDYLKVSFQQDIGRDGTIDVSYIEYWYKSKPAGYPDSL